VERRRRRIRRKLTRRQLMRYYKVVLIKMINVLDQMCIGMRKGGLIRIRLNK